MACGNVSIERTIEGAFYDPVITENAEDLENKIQYRLHSDGLLPNLYREERGNKCGPKFQDPVDDILNTYRELTLRLAIRDAIDRSEAANTAGNSEEKSKIFQTVEYTRGYQIQAEYTADTFKLAVAVVISLLEPVATGLVLFRGFWELGRDFSMSPLELAIAFISGASPRTMRAETDSDTNRTVTITESEETEMDSNNNRFTTILNGCRTNASAKEIVDGIRQGSQGPTVQYGVLDTTNRLGFAILGSEGVSRPQKDERLTAT